MFQLYTGWLAARRAVESPVTWQSHTGGFVYCAKLRVCFRADLIFCKKLRVAISELKLHRSALTEHYVTEES